MSYDFSSRSDLVGLARLTRSLQAVAEPMGVAHFLMGAAARDLMLKFAHDIQSLRATEDADFAVMVPSWKEFEALRAALIGGGQFRPRPGPVTHRLRHEGGLPLDIVPFGAVEGPNRTIAWPGDEGVVFDCFGIREAFEACIDVTLPEGVRLSVASIPGQVVLKISAWHVRKHTHPGRDAVDLLLFARNYMDCGNYERAVAEHADLLESPEFDYTEAGARLLARDMKGIVTAAAVERLLGILLPEADEEGPLLLASQSQMDLEAARRLLEVMCEELAG